MMALRVRLQARLGFNDGLGLLELDAINGDSIGILKGCWFWVSIMIGGKYVFASRTHFVLRKEFQLST